MEKKVSIYDLLRFIDSQVNLDGCWSELEEGLKNFVGYEIIDKTPTNI